MFNTNQYAFFINKYKMRYVYRIVDSTPTHYMVQVPFFSCWGSTFARWSKPKPITKTYLNKKCTLLPPELSTKYDNIKKGQSTSVLFDIP